MVKIDDKTHISLYAVLASIPFIVGAIIWLASIDAKANAAQDELRELRPLIQDIRERTIRIEEKLKKVIKNN